MAALALNWGCSSQAGNDIGGDFDSESDGAAVGDGDIPGDADIYDGDAGDGDWDPDFDFDPESEEGDPDTDGDSDPDGDWDDDLDDDADGVDDDSDPETVEDLFWWDPVPTEFTCSALPDVGEGVRIFSENSDWIAIGSTGTSSIPGWTVFTLFYLNASGPHHSAALYGCPIEGGAVYRLTQGRGLIYDFSVDYPWFGFNFEDPFTLLDEDYRNTVTVYNAIDDFSAQVEEMNWNSQGISLIFPYLVYISAFETPMYAPIVYSLEDGVLRKISDFRLPHDAFHQDGRHIAIAGYPWESRTAYGNYRNGVWAADLDDLVFHPIAVLDDGSNSSPQIEGNFIIYATAREAIRTSTHDWQSREIYLFDMKYKREIPLTDSPDENEFGPSMEYPYWGCFVEDGPSFYAGPHRFTHFETGETWAWSSRTNDASRIENRYVYNELGQQVIDVYRLPDAPRLPETDDCDDGNPCTDEHFWVTTNACHVEPNHDRCDDGDPGTLFDVCIDSQCRGLVLGEDDAPMADIPAGGFWWGNDGPPDSDVGDFGIGQSYEGPKRFEVLDAFSIDVHEVTNAQFEYCVTAGACAAPVRSRAGQILDYYNNPDYADWPVVYVNWYEARNYCEWVGKRLPTEAQWAKAARGTADERLFPWGDALPYNGRKANLNYDFPEMDDSDVAACGAYPEDVSPYGVYDLAGNVAEWTASPWTPTGLDGTAKWGDELMVTKGGNWFQQQFFSSWIDDRNPSTPWSAAMFIGFRCVK